VVVGIGLSKQLAHMTDQTLMRASCIQNFTLLRSKRQLAAAHNEHGKHFLALSITLLLPMAI